MKDKKEDGSEMGVKLTDSDFDAVSNRGEEVLINTRPEPLAEKPSSTDEEIKEEVFVCFGCNRVALKIEGNHCPKCGSFMSKFEKTKNCPEEKTYNHTKNIGKGD